MHTLCDSVEYLWIKARNALGARRRLFEEIRVITAHRIFPSWWDLMTGNPVWLPSLKKWQIEGSVDPKRAI